MAVTIEQPTIRREFLTLPETAELFGVSTRLVYKMIENGQLGCVKVASLKRVPVSEIERYREAARRTANAT